MATTIDPTPPGSPVTTRLRDETARFLDRVVSDMIDRLRGSTVAFRGRKVPLVVRTIVLESHRR